MMNVHSSLGLDLSGNASNFSSQCSTHYGFIIYCLDSVEQWSFYTQLIYGFYHARMLYFIFIYWNNLTVYIFQIVNEMFHIYFCMLNHSYILGVHFSMSQWMIFLMCCWTLLADILWSIFDSIFIRDIGAQIL